MKELTIKDTTEVNGGMAFLLIPILFAETTVTAGGVATAMGIGVGAGAIIGGIMAIFD